MVAAGTCVVMHNDPAFRLGRRRQACAGSREELLRAPRRQPGRCVARMRTRISSAWHAQPRTWRAFLRGCRTPVPVPNFPRKAIGGRTRTIGTGSATLERVEASAR